MNIGITEIKQIDNKQFQIVWTDGIATLFSLQELQESCPCALCADNKKISDPTLSAIKIKSVGRYAIQVDFTTGCSKGIFGYDHLRRLKGL